MSYLNQVIQRQAPLTRCQCAVLAVLSETPASVDAIWRRGAVYVDNRAGRVRQVAYGTVAAVLRSLEQQGFATCELKEGTKRVQYRTAHP